jgi:hypothetical protein
MVSVFCELRIEFGDMFQVSKCKKKEGKRI